MKKYNLKRTVSFGLVVASLVTLNGCSRYNIEKEKYRDFSVYDDDGNLVGKTLEDPFYLEYDNTSSYFVEVLKDNIKYLVDINGIGTIIAKGYDNAYFKDNLFIIEYSNGLVTTFVQNTKNNLLSR